VAGHHGFGGGRLFCDAAVYNEPSVSEKYKQFLSVCLRRENADPHTLCAYTRLRVEWRTLLFLIQHFGLVPAALTTVSTPPPPE